MTKIIQDKEVSIKHTSGAEIKTTYFNWIADAINTVPQGGFLPDEMRIRLLLSEKVAIAARENKDLEVELADMTKIKELIKSMPWVILDKQILNFIDYIDSL